MKYLIGILIITINISALSKIDQPITMEYITTDYSGIVSNGESVLCYGTNGIITRSTDKGDSWHRVSLYNKHHIKTIDTIGATYVGVVHDGLIVSSDNGNNWDIIPLKGSLDICHFGDSLYILTLGSIYVCTPTSLSSPKEMLQLDTLSHNRNLIVNKNYLHWIEDDTYIVNYSLDKKVIVKVDIKSVYVSPAEIRFDGLQHKGETLYVAVVEDHNNGSVTKLSDEYYEIFYSTDSGASWDSFSDIPGSLYKCKGMSNFTIINDTTAIALRTSDIIRKIPNQNRIPPQLFLGFEYLKFYRSGAIQRINITDTIPQHYAISSDLRIKNFIRMDNNTLIGAGNNHCIVRSTNNGATWNLQSYFPLLNESKSSADFRCVVGSMLYMPSSNGVFYKTVDAGVTILPQRFHFYPQLSSSIVSFSHFDEHGKGCVIMTTLNGLDSNVFITDDYGETFTPINNIELFHYHKDSLKLETKLSNVRVRQVTETEGVFLLSGTPTYKDSVTYSSYPFSVIIRLDKGYKYIDTVHIPVNVIQSLTVYDKVLYLIGMNQKDKTPKTKIEDVKEFPEYTMFKSKDDGKTWSVVVSHVPLPKEILHVGNFYYTKQFALQPSGVFNSSMLFVLRPETLLLYSFEKEKFDTLSLPFRASASVLNINTIFKSKDNIAFVTDGNNIVFTPMLDGKNTVWDSVQIAQLLFWSNDRTSDGDPLYVREGFIPSKTDTGFVVINEYKGRGLVLPSYKVHLARYFPYATTSTVEMEGERTYLWNSAPFPQPTRGEVSTKVFWDLGFSTENVSVSLMNILGDNIRIQSIRTTPIQQSAALFTLNVSNLPTGIYLLRIQLKNEVRIMPFMVAE